MDRLSQVVAIDRDEVDLRNGLISLAILAGIVGARVVVGPRVFLAALAALFVLLFSAHAKHIWKVVLVAALAGSVVTATASQVSDGDLTTLTFVWVVTFVASTTVTMPLLSSIAALINIWAIMALNLVGGTDLATHGAAPWIAGCVLGGIAFRYLEKHGHRRHGRLVDIDRTTVALDYSVRPAVVYFAAVRATAVMLAGAVGLLVFDHHPWWAATATLMVAGINPDESKLVAWQRAVGTLAGAVVAMFLLKLSEETMVTATLLLAVLFLTLLFRTASQTLFALGLTTVFILVDSLLGGSAFKLGSARILETLIGIGFALVAIRLTHPALQRIGVFQQARMAARKSAMKPSEEPT